MDFNERIAMRPMLWIRLSGLTEGAFEDFFHDVMSATDPGFVDVRTHGNIGDKSSDGLSLHSGKLYACYAPPTPGAGKTVRKFESDLEGAKTKRSGEFDTFVFVHNDVRGTHPELATALAEARNSNPNLSFEQMGHRQFRDRLEPLDVTQVESLLGTQLSLHHVTKLGLEEMEELLFHLEANRVPSDPNAPVVEVSERKLAFSDLTSDTQAEIRDAMKFSSLIEDYYASRIDVTERDEVAARFNREYMEAAELLDDADSVLDRLIVFLLGSRMPTQARWRAAFVILAYFFQTCDIFLDPPANGTETGVQA